MDTLPSEILSHIYGFDPTFRVYFKNHILSEIECFHSKCLCRCYADASVDDCQKNSFQFYDENHYPKYGYFQEIEWNVFNVEIIDVLSNTSTSHVKTLDGYAHYTRLPKNETSSFMKRLTCIQSECVCTMSS